MKTEILKLGKSDFAKGLIMAGLAAILTGVYTSIQAGELPTTLEQLKPIGLSAIGAMVAYLMKNFMSNSDGAFLKKEDAAK